MGQITFQSAIFELPSVSMFKRCLSRKMVDKKRPYKDALNSSNPEEDKD